MTQEQKAHEIWDSMKGFRVTNLHRKKCCKVMIDGIIEAIKVTTGHCDLRKLERQEVQSDIEFYQGVKQIIEQR